MSETTPDEDKAVQDTCKRWCTQLQNPERMVRQNTLKEILDHFESNKLTSVNCQTYYDELYIHLLKAYSDKYEACRSMAASVVSAALKHLPKNSSYLEYICTILSQRLSQAEIIEESEELRLQLIQQLHDLIRKFQQGENSNEDLILKAYNDIIDILIRTIKDPYPTIQKESCEIVKSLAKATPSFRYRAEVLTKPITLMLQHRYSANRAVAIETLAIVALNIQTNDDKVGNIIMDLSKSLMDDVPIVRRECGRAGILLGLELKDRYSHFSKILPLILCCLVDETETVRSEIQAGWVRVGARYYDENAEELKQRELIDKIPESYPSEIERPTLGCRVLVERNLKMVNIILHEMEDWKEEIRLHSTKLLGQVIIHAEKLFATQFIDAYPVLAKTCVDSERIVAAEAVLITLQLGTFLDYSCWGDFVRKQMLKQPYLGNLKCYTALFTAAPNGEKLKDLKEISETLLDSSISQNSNSEYQAQLLQFIDILSDALLYIKSEESAEGPEICLTEQNLYCITMKVLSLSNGNQELQHIGQEVLFKLSTYMYGTPFNMHQKYLSSLLNQIEGLDIECTEVTEQVILLSGVIRICGVHASNLNLLKPKIIIALKSTCPEGQIRILTAIAEVILQWNHVALEKAEEEHEHKLLKEFLEEIVSPYLIWKAGTSAESVRTMATACLCATIQGAALTVGQLLISDYAEQIVPLIEDNSVGTRAYSIRALLSSGPLELTKFKSLVFQVLARLDDASSEVRELSAKCLGILKPVITDEVQQDVDSIIDQVIERMILHLESPEQKLQELLATSIQVIGKNFPVVLKKHVEAIPEKYPFKRLLLDNQTESVESSQ